ncbi:Abi family protein [bacterium]|nr:Abi family protein [bacterium]
MPKPAKTIEEQIQLLQDRGMLFHNVADAPHFLGNISYYRLKGYWWEMQIDNVNHKFAPNSYFEDVINFYNFDRHFRLIIFNAIERIEIALRTKLKYHMSLAYGSHWHYDPKLFQNAYHHNKFIAKLENDVNDSSEEFMKKHYKNHKEEIPESWKSLEIITLGSLSKLFQNIEHQLPEKSTIAAEFGLNNQKYLASWLLSTTYIRNIVAHHSRLWNRVIINKYDWPKSTKYPLLSYSPDQHQRRKIFPLVSAILYMNNRISPGHHLKEELFELFQDFPNTPLYKMGFPENWQNEPIWK